MDGDCGIGDDRPAEAGLLWTECRLGETISSSLAGLGDHTSRGVGAEVCPGGSNPTVSEADSRSREESSKIGEGTDAETVGISL